MRVRGSALIQQKGKILMLVYDYPGGLIHAIPGGGLHDGETLADSIRREFREELSIDIEVGGLRFVGDMMARDNVIKQTVHIVFDGSIADGEPALNRSFTSAQEFRWVPLEELSNLKLYPAITQPLLEDLATGGAQPRYLGDCLAREWVT
jgi:ADP-ribose pyrophosphatase YjhB (NUDIX family)